MASENSTAKAGAGKARISLGRQKPVASDASDWKRPAVADRPLLQFTFDNFPNSFREWNEADMQEGNRALAWFLREASCGLVQRFAEQDAPNHGGDELAVRGMELAFDLLIDRMDVLAGQSPMPYLKDVPGRGEGAMVPDGWTDGGTLRMAVQKAGAD